jgi:hypothetical protein
VHHTLHLQQLLQLQLKKLTAASSDCSQNLLTPCVAHLLLLLLLLLLLVRPSWHCSSRATWVLSRMCATSTQGTGPATALQQQRQQQQEQQQQEQQQQQ